MQHAQHPRAAARAQVWAPLDPAHAGGDREAECEGGEGGSHGGTAPREVGGDLPPEVRQPIGTYAASITTIAFLPFRIFPHLFFL